MMRAAVKIFTSRSELTAELAEARGNQKTIGFTSGTFDLLHAGHVEYLEQAGTCCDLLVVGLNTDSSVAKYKNPLRPIVPALQRARVLSALAAVDYVLLFAETNNNQNIRELKPDFYIKAGDYQIRELSSAPIVQEYGGEVRIIPIQSDTSTSKIINNILQKYSAQDQHYIPKGRPEAGQAVLFLDRDGTIIRHRDYLFDPDFVELLPGAAAGIKQFQDAGYRVVIVTNQPGIDFGYLDYEKMFQVNKEMLIQLSKLDVLIDKIYFSPYTKAASTACRKPGTALFEQADREINVNKSQSLMVGDQPSDIAAGQAFGIRTAMVGELPGNADYLVDSIAGLAKKVLG